MYLLLNTYHTLWMMIWDDLFLILTYNRIKSMSITTRLFSTSFMTFSTKKIKEMKMLKSSIMCWLQSEFKIQCLKKLCLTRTFSSLKQMWDVEIVIAAKAEWWLYAKITIFHFSSFFFFLNLSFLLLFFFFFFKLQLCVCFYKNFELCLFWSFHMQLSNVNVFRGIDRKRENFYNKNRSKKLIAWLRDNELDS